MWKAVIQSALAFLWGLIYPQDPYVFSLPKYFEHGVTYICSSQGPRTIRRCARRLRLPLYFNTKLSTSFIAGKVLSRSLGSSSFISGMIWKLPSPIWPATVANNLYFLMIFLIFAKTLTNIEDWRLIIYESAVCLSFTLLRSSWNFAAASPRIFGFAFVGSSSNPFIS